MDLSHELYPEIFNSIPEHIAILDEFGTIQVVNSAWESYALQNGGIRSQIGIGNN